MVGKGDMGNNMDIVGGAKIVGTHIHDQIDAKVCWMRVLAFGALCGWQLNCKIIIFITNLTTATIAV